MESVRSVRERLVRFLYLQGHCPRGGHSILSSCDINSGTSKTEDAEGCHEKMEEIIPLLKPTHRQEPHSGRRKRNATITFFFVALGILISLTVLLSGKWLKRGNPSRTIHILSSGNSWDFAAISEGEYSESDIEICYQYGKNKTEEKILLEAFLIEKGIELQPGSPSYLHQTFLKSTKQAKQMAHCSFMAEQANRRMKEMRKSKTTFECIRNHSVTCQEDNPYREIDGSCNNNLHPTWGKSLMPYVRLLGAEYRDGISIPRKSRTGKALPSARKISTSLYRNKPHLESKSTLLTMLWGLFVDHDMTNTAISQGKDGKPITCCHDDVKTNRSCLHPECYPISVPEDDHFFSRFNVTCMEFVRSSPVKTEGSAQRQQLNQITSFLDGSAIYGSSLDELAVLRSFQNGTLLSSDIHNTEGLPKVVDRSSFCGLPKMKLYCFHAGDSRANEQVELTAIHTLWLREHNRIAGELLRLNPQWDDEKIFQEARKIVSAELQHVTYNEYLPLLLGNSDLGRYGVELLSTGYYHGYNPTLNPTISNVFASAAFRFGHSQVQDFIQLISAEGKVSREIALHETFFNPTVLYTEGIDYVFRGITKQYSKAVWSQMTVEIQNRLFQSHFTQYGLDLPAISIQRGRDHGLPPYVRWRTYCHLSKVQSWDDLRTVLDAKNAEVLRNLYESVEDVDLIPAALSEIKTEGHLLGPTHACLVAEQFRRTRNGDRFWYENENIFTPDQLREIRKVTLSRLICDNSDELVSIQRSPLHALNSRNPKVFCSNSTLIPHLDLEYWRSRMNHPTL